jgi:hypothetical protein
MQNLRMNRPSAVQSLNPPVGIVYACTDTLYPQEHNVDAATTNKEATFSI